VAFPWLRVLDAVIGVTDIARSRRIGKLRDENESRQLDSRVPAAPLGGLETRLAGVVVAALKEAFDRDAHRLDIERERIEAERKRADRALRLELARQAGDREIGRLRLLAGIATAAAIGTLLVLTSSGGHFRETGARFTLVVGWLMLLGSIGASISGQSQIARSVGRLSKDADMHESEPSASGVAGATAMWLLIGALAIIGVVVIAV